VPRVAIGWHTVLEIPRPEGAEHISPGQRPGFGWKGVPPALKGRQIMLKLNNL